MKFLVDAQLPPALARWLTEQSHPSQHVADLSLTSSSDRNIWQYAKDNGLTIITKDEDFSHLSLLDPLPAPVVWVRVGNCSRAALLNWFAPLLPDIVAALEQGETLVELV